MYHYNKVELMIIAVGQPNYMAVYKRRGYSRPLIKPVTYALRSPRPAITSPVTLHSPPPPGCPAAVRPASPPASPTPLAPRFQRKVERPMVRAVDPNAKGVSRGAGRERQAGPIPIDVTPCRTSDRRGDATPVRTQAGKQAETGGRGGRIGQWREARRGEAGDLEVRLDGDAARLHLRCQLRYTGRLRLRPKNSIHSLRVCIA